MKLLAAGHIFAGVLIAVSPDALQGRSGSLLLRASRRLTCTNSGVEQESASTEFLLVHPRSM